MLIWHCSCAKTIGQVLTWQKKVDRFWRRITARQFQLLCVTSRTWVTGTQSGASLPVLLVDGSTPLFPSALSTSEPHGCCQLPGERQVWDSDCRQPCLHWWETSGQRANSFILTLPRQPAAGGTQSIQSIYNRLILKWTVAYGWRKGPWQKEVRALALKQTGAT